MEAQVLDALRAVLDPEVGVNIVDLGLVELVDARPDRIYVALIMTTPACPQGAHIADEARRALRDGLGAAEVDVELLPFPMWSPDRMSEAAKRQLGWAG